MKVAIAAKGNNPDAKADPLFERAGEFIVLDTENENFEDVSNQQNMDYTPEADVRTAQNVASRSVGAIITSNCSLEAFRAFSNFNIKVFLGVIGTVKETFECFKNGKIQEATGAVVEGRW